MTSMTPALAMTICRVRKSDHLAISGGKELSGGGLAKRQKRHPNSASVVVQRDIGEWHPRANSRADSGGRLSGCRQWLIAEMGSQEFLSELASG